MGVQIAPWERANFGGRMGVPLSKIRHLRTIAQLCRAISLQLRYLSTIGKKLVKQQYLPHLSSLAAEVGSLVWGTPANFNRFRIFAALLHGTLVVGIS